MAVQYTYSKLNHKQLSNILTQLGYHATKVNGSHIAYSHANPESKILVKQARANEIVPLAVIASVMSNVIYSNVADAKQLETLTQEVTKQ